MIFRTAALLHQLFSTNLQLPLSVLVLVCDAVVAWDFINQVARLQRQHAYSDRPSMPAMRNAVLNPSLTSFSRPSVLGLLDT